MSQHKLVKQLPALATGETLPATLTPFVVPEDTAVRFVRAHTFSLAAYIQCRTSRFNLLSYFHHSGPNLISCLQAGYTHKELYDLLTRDQEQPLPVSYVHFTRTLATFRQEKGLPPTQVCRARESVQPPSFSSQPPAPAADISVLASAQPAPRENTVELSPVVAPSVALTKDAGGSTLSTISLPAIPPTHDPADEDPDDKYARLRASIFPPFTRADIRKGKPIAEVAADMQREEVAAYERQLRDGTLTPDPPSR